MNLHIGEDGAALFDDEGRRVATLSLYAFATPMECRRDDGRDERRLALARQFAASGDLLQVVEEMMRDADNACNPHQDECETEEDDGCTCWVGRAREALRKAGR